MISRFMFRKSLIFSFVFLFVLSAIFSADAVYINRFTTTDNGGLLFTGNTLGLSKQTNLNEPGPKDSIGAFLTIDATQQVGNYLPGTTLNWRENSSFAYLDLPANSTVLYAELIWSGSFGFGNQITGNEPDTPITLINPQGAPFTITPDPVTSQSVLTPGFTNSGNYARSANVTSIIQAGGAGIYIAGGIAATVAASDNSRNAAGWTLAVAYRDGTMPTQNMTIFVGCEQASNNTNAPASISGFCGPASGPLSGTLFVSAIEGDANIMGDRMLFGSATPLTSAANSLSGVNNPINNFFCSQINTLFPSPGFSAILDTRGYFGNFNSNPATGNIPYASRQGYDITAVDVSSKLVYNQTTAYALGITTGDNYTINALGLAIPIGAPTIDGTKTVNGEPAVTAQVGDIVTFDFTYTNNGAVPATNVVFKDPLESGLTYTPGSFIVNGVPQADPNLTTGYLVGNLGVGASFTVQFQAQVTGYPPSHNIILNNSTVDYQFSTCIPDQTLQLAANTNQVSIELPSPLIPNIATLKLVNSTVAIDSELGATLTFQVLLRNNGTGDSLNVVLQDVLETGLTLVPGSVNVDNQTITPDPDLSVGLVLGNILTGQTVRVVFQATIDSNPPTGNVFYNRGTVDYQYQEFQNVFSDLSTTTNQVSINLTPAPSAFQGVLKTCRFFDRTNYCLTMTWLPVFGSQVVAYNIYHNGARVATVPASGPLLYKTCFKSKRQAQGFEIAALFSDNHESQRTPLVIIYE